MKNFISGRYPPWLIRAIEKAGGTVEPTRAFTKLDVMDLELKSAALKARADLMARIIAEKTGSHDAK